MFCEIDGWLLGGMQFGGGCFGVLLTVRAHLARLMLGGKQFAVLVLVLCWASSTPFARLFVVPFRAYGFRVSARSAELSGGVDSLQRNEPFRSNLPCYLGLLLM